MNENLPYQQGAFDLTPRTPDTSASIDSVPDITRTPDMPPVLAPGDETFRSLIGRPDQFHTSVASNRAVPGEAWAEYVLEAEFRSEHDLPPVSPAEFAQMTDWGRDFPTLPDDTSEDEGAATSAYGPSFAERERLADGPEGERPRFRQETSKPTKVAIENTVFDARQERVARAMDTLTHGVERITTSEGYRRYLEAMARFHTYSANNVMLIHTQRPEATRVASYRTWQALGRQVVKGEKGITIIRPVIVKGVEEETGAVSETLRGFTTGGVFDVEQTRGLALPEAPHPGLLPEDEIEAALTVKVAVMKLLDGYGVQVVREQMPEGRRGYWEPGKKTVGLNHDLAGVGELKTLLHEAAHCLGDHRPGAIDRADGETVAESVAFVVLQHYGVDTGDYTFPYVAGWAKDRAVLDRNLGAIRGVSHLLIAAIGDDCLPDTGESGEGDGNEIGDGKGKGKGNGGGAR